MNTPRYASMGRSVVLMGGGGHAAVVADAARLSGWHVLGFVSDSVPSEAERDAQQHAELAWLGTTDALADILKKAPPETEVFAAVGDPGLRETWCQHAASLGATLGVIVHPTAAIADTATIERGAFVCAQAVVGPRAVVHEGSIVNTSAVVEHDADVGSWSHVAPGSVLTGGVKLGRAVTVGARAVVIPERTVGDGAFVAAGAVVTQSVEPGARVAGCPAMPMQKPQRAPARGGI